MIYTDEQLRSKITEMIRIFETEAVEFKEAKSSYSFNDIGKYFSALSNEANLRSLREAWLIFGVTNQKEIRGTSYRQDKKGGSLQSLKKEIAASTNERLTFLEIYETELDGCRIIAFQIPPRNSWDSNYLEWCRIRPRRRIHMSIAHEQGGLNTKPTRH